MINSIPISKKWIPKSKTLILEKTHESDGFEETQEVEEKPRKLNKSPSIRKTQETQPFYDSIINLGILNQLKLLGEEMKTQWEQKNKNDWLKKLLINELEEQNYMKNHNKLNKFNNLHLQKYIRWKTIYLMIWYNLFSWKMYNNEIYMRPPA